jgi:hypothetical protein
MREAQSDFIPLYGGAGADYPLASQRSVLYVAMTGW